MARSNVLTTAKRIRRQLGLGSRAEEGVLVTGVDGATTTTTIAFSGLMPKSVQIGAVLGIELELMRVVSIDTAAKTCQVIRAYLDSDAAVHGASSLIEVNPRFTLFDIVDAMLTELQSWGKELYYPDTQVLAAATSAQSVELPVLWTDAFGVIECVQSEVSVDVTVWPRIKYRLIRGVAGVASSPAPTSGLLLRFLEPVRTGSIVVTVARPFPTTLFDSTHDLITDMKLTPGMIDVLELGARLRLLMQSDDQRGSRGSQDDPRRAEETPPGSTITLSQLRLGRYTQRKGEEVGNLRRSYPIRQV